MFTLKELTLKHASGELTDTEVRKLASNLPKVELIEEGKQSWYEGDPDNTSINIEALIRSALTREQVDSFFDILLSD